MTLYDLTKKIHAIFASNPNVRTVIEGDVYELNSIPDAEFGVGVITNNTSTLMTDEYVQYGFNLFAVDRLTSDDSNRLDVQSWAVQLLKDVISQLDEIGIFAVNEWQVQTFKERFAQSCSGAYVTVSFRVPYEDCNQFKLVTSVNGKVGDVVIPSAEGIFTVDTNRGRYYFTDSIPNSRFSVYGSLIEFATIGNGCRFIESSAFSSCKKLENVTIPNGVEFIQKYAFEKCESLTSVTLPTSLLLLGDQSFYGCKSLTNVVFNGVAYDTVSELETALKTYGIAVFSNVFGNTGLK